jgi:cytochrome c551/c552
MSAPATRRRRAPTWAAALPLAGALLLGGAPASAFCRSTTCVGDCPRDDEGCKTTGNPLRWPGLCVGFSLQRDGTANLPIESVRKVIRDSFVAWSDLDCGGGTASLAFSQLADVSCHQTEHKTGGPNANIILFQDTQWRYHGEFDTLAKTTVTFDAATGDILDADIEINAAYNELTVADDNVVYDLQSIVTHEIGHFLGLDHSLDFDATMNAAYDTGSTANRTLAPDDVAAACAVYPPARGGECHATPPGGLADACVTGGGGCSVTTSAPREREQAPAALALAAFALVAGRARRSSGARALGGRR